MLKSGLLVAVLVLAPLTNSSLAQTQGPTFSPDWKTVVQRRLPVYGHRNWIIVADSAFPAYAEPGIETVAVKVDLLSVLRYVAGAISSSRHVRATVFLDEELEFVEEHDYPGVLELAKQIRGVFSKDQISSVPHTEVLTRIDEAGKTFRILFIKTTETIPYSSVYIRLDCGYMSDEVEQKIRTRMAAAANRQPR
jgi:D-ribose pyranose/furanose isomerase RbsD